MLLCHSIPLESGWGNLICHNTVINVIYVISWYENDLWLSKIPVYFLFNNISVYHLCACGGGGNVHDMSRYIFRLVSPVWCVTRRWCARTINMASTRICVLHIDPTVTGKIRQFENDTWAKVKDAASQRKTLFRESKYFKIKLENTFSDMDGYHVQCYRNFTAVRKITVEDSSAETKHIYIYIYI